MVNQLEMETATVQLQQLRVKINVLKEQSVQQDDELQHADQKVQHRRTVELKLVHNNEQQDGEQSRKLKPPDAQTIKWRTKRKEILNWFIDLNISLSWIKDFQ